MISLAPQSRPMLARGVRLRQDPITGGPVLLFPEGVLPLDDTTHDIITRCTGDATFDSIILALASDYEIDLDTIRRDVGECLAQLRRQMLIVLRP